MMSIPISQWQIKTPTVYRYLPEKFIDEFFDTGRIRLGSFYEFAKHPDEEKGDGKEGKNILVGIGTKQTVFAAVGHGFDAFLLCGSTLLSSDLMKRFDSSAALEIRNTTAFGITIARKLAGLRQGIEGFCAYRDGSIEVNIGDFEFEQLKAESKSQNISLDKLGAFVLNMGGLEVFFRKRLAYQHQVEYRLIWLMDHEIKDAIILEVPEARQFCAKRNL